MKRKKYISFQFGEEKPIRCNSLKGNYTEEAIRERIEKINTTVSEKTHLDLGQNSKKMNLLIEIERSIQTKNSPGYERWAKLFNLKQAAQTLVYLQENQIEDYKNLEEKTRHCTKYFYELSEKIKKIETKLSEISELQKQISNYGRTKDIYILYKKSGYNKKYFAEHEQDIIIHQAAKKVFDGLKLEKIPSIKTLQKEYAMLKSEKNSLYKEYKVARETMRTLAVVKTNTDQLLQYSETKMRSEKEQVRQ